MDSDDRLRLDYDQTTQYLRTLKDVRFKLLAFVPTIATAAVGLVGRLDAEEELLGVGLLGLVATGGILLYELRNAQIMVAVEERARELEQRLGLASIAGASGASALVAGPPGPAPRVAGLLETSHRAGLALVYGAALAGWSYLVAWAALGAFDVPRARALGGLAGVAGGLLVLRLIIRTLPSPS